MKVFSSWSLSWNLNSFIYSFINYHLSGTVLRVILLVMKQIQVINKIGSNIIPIISNKVANGMGGAGFMETTVFTQGRKRQ